MSDDIIIITAAGAGTWLRERFTPSGVVRWLGEGLVSDYAQKMETLRLIDDKIYEWSKDLNTYVDLMEGAFKSKRLVDLASVSLVISNTLKKVTLQEQFIKNISEESLAEFEKERGDLSSWWRDPTESPSLSEEEISSQMKNRGKNQPGGKNAQLNSSLDLIKEAGWWDDLTRKWVHRKIRSKKIQERDTELQMFFSKTKNIVSRVRNLADKLHALRASGEIGKYLDTLREISKLQNEFENDPKTGFRAIYRKHLRELVENIIKNKEGLESLEDVEDAVTERASPDARKGVEGAQQGDPPVGPARPVGPASEPDRAPAAEGGGDDGERVGDDDGGDEGDDEGGDEGDDEENADPLSQAMQSLMYYLRWIASISDESFKNKDQKEKEELIEILEQTWGGYEALKKELIENNNLKYIKYIQFALEQIAKKILLWKDILYSRGISSEPKPASAPLPSTPMIGSAPDSPPAPNPSNEIPDLIPDLEVPKKGINLIDYIDVTDKEFESLSYDEQTKEINKLRAKIGTLKKQIKSIFESEPEAKGNVEALTNVESKNQIQQLKSHIDFIENIRNKWSAPPMRKSKNASEYYSFITKLSSCSNQYEAANLLLKYSQEIEEHDLNTSLKLLAIAEGLLDE